ncbi:MAG TPA: S8 family serine peptidase [Gemmataceae bacterium]|nr:S8 family serine peptidase [Gemmataceae bacterium]
MRRLLLGLFVLILAAPAGAFAQPVRYEVRGKTVRLETDPDYLLVRPKKDVSARAAVEAAIRAQAKLVSVGVDKYLKALDANPPVMIRQVRGVLVPRLKGMDNADVDRLASAAGDELRSSERVYRFKGKTIIAQGTLSIRFKREIPRSFIEDLKLQELNRPEYARHVVRVQPPEKGVDLFALAERLRQRDDVLWAEPDLVFQVQRFGSERLPNDTYLKNQWHLQSIHAPEAWALSVGSDKITVAVLDDGVDLKHMDLKDKLVKGYDFVEHDEDPQPDPEDAHGTCCAGLIASATDNSTGTAGVAWHAKIMPLRIVGPKNWAGADAVAQAFLFAKEHGAKVLSNSWGLNLPINQIADAIDTVTEAGCLVFCSAGNAIPAKEVSFPANYESCLAVGAIGHDDRRLDYSCFGPGHQVFLVAPSGKCNLVGDIWTTDHSGKDGYNPGDANRGDAEGDYIKGFGGTSAACPIVAGVAALVWSAYPNLSAAQVRQILLDTADKVDAENGKWKDGRSKQYGYGKVNALAAMRKAEQVQKTGDLAIPESLRLQLDQLGKGLGQPGKTPGDAAKHASYLKALLQPTEESWQVRGQTVTVRPSRDWLAAVLPVDADQSKEALAALLQKDADAGAIKEIRKGKTRRIVLVPRKAVKQLRDLRAVPSSSLPSLLGVYQSGDNLLVALNTLTCRLNKAEDVEKLRTYAVRQKLDIVEHKGEVVKLRWTRQSAFATVFDALHALGKDVPLRWCEPDLLRQINKFGKD